ncbi:hypothetical protein DIQ79_03270 [Mycolicibacterium smegmatis]|uniref:Uncharacterized protein n=1 Tax=Mycolicibacterium smegmatis (strain ATCC 700084 / mc(2)155) TaxID=246196 RepID=A0QWX2_MYCS2|nr:hypothetical protein MSMEG_3096 [Mycolicibacterium smegmatis MC2 155]TBM52833.1 hypothetical protein DIQ86_02310 [Mycolicibacterium smegmatis]TBH51701.1 hypothetical protein EYS45_02405 [Mycolicibacterium smegmatis MC2 155]TBM55444.1 hypothetical protein DIQ85_03265 [Mycolicibacterium smegmatis]TBM66514.1 hypothetical protein DIQ83_03270 [Mycolicibacterium smegmatis]
MLAGRAVGATTVVGVGASVVIDVVSSCGLGKFGGRRFFSSYSAAKVD